MLGLATGLPFGAIVRCRDDGFPAAPGEAIGAVNLYAVTSIIIATPLVGLSFTFGGDGQVGFVALAVLAAARTRGGPSRHPEAARAGDRHPAAPNRAEGVV